MRLIDADLFPKEIEDVETDPVGIGIECGIQKVLNEIHNAPTVDTVPVVHGAWLKATGMMPPEYFGKHMCSVCNNFAPNEFRRAHEWLSPMCPYCGAKMDKKEGEQDG